MINVNEVVVSRDLSHAKVYVTSVEDKDQHGQNEAVAALNNAAGFLRSLAAKQLEIRVTPRLQFVYDETTTRGAALSSLIDKAVASDKANTDDPDSGAEKPGNDTSEAR
jgi:ribosome-binding factor A